VITYAIEYRSNRHKLIKKSDDCDKVIKLASESNNSIANKIIEIDGRLSDLSMSINSIRSNTWSNK